MTHITSEQLAAIHEAAHAVIAHGRGVAVHGIKLERDSGDINGNTEIGPTPEPLTAAEIGVAGAIAQIRFGLGVVGEDHASRIVEAFLRLRTRSHFGTIQWEYDSTSVSVDGLSLANCHDDSKGLQAVSTDVLKQAVENVTQSLNDPQVWEQVEDVAERIRQEPSKSLDRSQVLAVLQV